MGQWIAVLFRYVFKIPFFRKKYYGFHKHIFSSFNLFRNVHFDITYRDNISLKVHLSDWIQQQIYFLGDYEKQETDYLYQTLKENDVFIDIGANIGLFSLNAAKIVKENGSVYAFEAFSQNYLQCLENVNRNHLKNITVENLAISDTNGKLDILYNEDDKNIGMASSYLSNFTFREEATCVSLDNYTAEKNIEKIDLIKIDIEGGEYNALLGMEETLLKYSPRILIEINETALSNSNHTSGQLIDLLEKYGYQKTKILSSNPQSYNAVFEKPTDSEKKMR